MPKIILLSNGYRLHAESGQTIEFSTKGSSKVLVPFVAELRDASGEVIADKGRITALNIDQVTSIIETNH